MLEVQQLDVGGFDHNFSYIVRSGTETALVDPTGKRAVILDALGDVSSVRYILLTHSHGDHTENVKYFKARFPEARIVAHPKSALAPDIRLTDHQLLPFGDTYFEAIFTPGHSPDSVCYRDAADTALFTGDTLFIECCGFGHAPDLYNSLKNIIGEMDDHLSVYSGHDYGSVKVRSLGAEKHLNPYLSAPDFETFKSRMTLL